MHHAAAESLLDDPQLLREALAKRDRTIAELRSSVHELTDQLERFKEQILNQQRARFGQSSERGAYAMGDLFHPCEAPRADDDERPAAEPPAARAPALRRPGDPPRGRRTLPPELPREIERHDYDAEELERLRAANGGKLEEIGVEATETLEYEPGHLYVKRHEVPKYAVRGDDGERTVVSPRRPTPPMPGSQVGASVLAHTVVSKFVDHLPLNRISKQLERDGLGIPRQRLCDYSLYTASLLAPLALRIHNDALACPVLHSDDTTVPQLEAGRSRTRTCRLWLYLGRGRDDGVIPVAFEYTSNRQQDGPLSVLADYRGYVQADAYSAYRNAENQWPAVVATARQTRALPILRRLRALLESMSVSLPPRSELGKAVAYALNHWAGLLRYTEDGRLEPDNNRGERALRGVCLGRKNWNFTGSKNGGHALAILLTVVETCKQNGVNPRRYLVDVLERIQDHPVNRLEELLPYNWVSTDATG